NNTYSSVSIDERARLKFADLVYPQELAYSPGPSTASTHCACIDDPAINERCHTSEQVLRPINEPAIELVEIKFTAQQFNFDRFGRASTVESNCESDSHNKCNNC